MPGEMQIGVVIRDAAKPGGLAIGGGAAIVGGTLVEGDGVWKVPIMTTLLSAAALPG